jgi:hypothetical protein
MLVREIRQPSLGDSLDCVAPALQSFVRETLPATITLARPIPASIVSIFGFESRLDSDEAASDFLFATNLASGGRDLLSKPFEVFSAHFPAGWQSIVNFCGKWADPANILFAGADDVWFEFDVSSGGAQSRTPSFFFGPRIGLEPDEPPMRKTSRILNEGFLALRGAPLSASLREELERLLEILPEHARIFQAGLMLSRQDSPIRICIDNLSLSELNDCIRNHLGSECAASVMATLEPFQASLISVRPSFDLGRPDSARVGLECYAAVPQREANPGAWQPMLRHLKETGLCTPARYDLLLELPPFVSSNESNLNDGDHLLSSLVGREWGYSLKLHHVKLTVQPGTASYAKSYVAVQKVWLT